MEAPITLIAIAVKEMMEDVPADDYAPVGAPMFPVVQQRSRHDCAYACVGILTTYNGMDKVTNPPSPETHLSIEDLLISASRGGFAGHAFRTSFSWLREKVPPPFIVHWKGDHFVVVYRIDHTHVGISDPSTGTLREMTKQEFVQGWLGHIVGPGSWKRGVVVYLEKKASDAQ